MVIGHVLAMFTRCMTWMAKFLPKIFPRIIDTIEGCFGRGIIFRSVI